MLFNSFSFLLFFPIVTMLYFLLPHKARWFFLLSASCVFYMFFIPIYILILLITIVIDYIAGIYIEKTVGEKRKIYLVVSILSTCLVLFIFKYFNFFNTNFSLLADYFHLNYPIQTLNIILPIGLSFHTFQSLSYVIEVYRGNQKAEKHFGIYSLYVMFYPQLVAGPIERPQNMLHQFHEKHTFKYDDMVEGLKLILWGVFKKVVIADRLSLYVNSVYNNPNQHSGISLLVATFFFAFQIYCDFSGYSDIAIGSGRVMGFRLMTNFRRPYFSQSVAEFWKRWHISLSTWFRDYLYISMGGNRVSKVRHYFNLFITFTVSGFWHGANWTYVIWGALNGIFLIIPQALKINLDKLQKSKFIIFIRIIKTFILICFTWIFFRANTFSDGILVINKIVHLNGTLFIGGNKDMIYSTIFLLLLIIVEMVDEFKLSNGFSFFNHPKPYVRYFAYWSISIIILLFGVFDGSQFIYFQF
ncbi:MAG: MBOAT family O-acyltransferase [Bacteroidia bacterium]